MKDEDIKKVVRDGYAQIASGGGCCGPAPTCCGGQDPIEISRRIGYTEEEVATAPAGANLGLGCGNPVALASLREGEVVVDLGSGAGFDCFLAAERVGPKGRVIGVDMTPEMVKRGRGLARSRGYENVEFRLGEMEHLPLADASVDVVISNCAINLSPDKDAVFAEAFRVLRAGGRLMVSDIVLLKELPAEIKVSREAYVGCVAGALRKEDYLAAIRGAGFVEVSVIEQRDYQPHLEGVPPRSVVGIAIAAVKPR